MRYLIDAAFLLNGPGFEPGMAYVTTAGIDREFRDSRSRMLVDNAIRLGALKLLEPSSDSLARVNADSLSRRLSKPDRELAALALDLKNAGEESVVYSDDYSLLNFLKSRGIAFEPVLREGIKRVRK
ncbi:MAG: hypothetical protein HY917_00545 [Candidatus Diapherotrites archaeon]|nr:hypothetical protein [Candidatus Diapherotrites archaeon]